MNGSAVVVDRLTEHQLCSAKSDNPTQLTSEDSLRFLNVSILVGGDQASHRDNLWVILVPDHQLPLQRAALDSSYGLVSCESKGLISLPMSMYVRTRYFNT